jgi:hypothetical protein
MVNPFKQPKQYFWNILISLDQFANTLCGGDPDETMSSRMGRNLVEGNKGKIAWRVKLCKILSILDPRDGNHCIESIGE